MDKREKWRIGAGLLFVGAFISFFATYYFSFVDATSAMCCCLPTTILGFLLGIVCWLGAEKEESAILDSAKETVVKELLQNVLTETGYIVYSNNAVLFKGGHGGFVEKTSGGLNLSKTHIAFASASSNKFFAIPLKKLIDVQIVSDNYTPSLARGVFHAFTDTADVLQSQSYRPHNNNLQISFKSGKIKKQIQFEFEAMTWAGSVSSCQEFMSQLNALL